MATHNWNIDVAHSGINFSIRHMVVSKVRGRFTKFTGVLRLDEGGDLTRSSVEASIDAAGIDTGSAQRDDHLRGADFFDVDRFPQLRFRSTLVVKLAEDRYGVVGELTIRDVTREVVIDAEYAGRGKDPWGVERVAFSAKTAIDRKDFGLAWNQVLEAGGMLVGDRVEIEFDVQVVKATASKAA
jgi:polyisoprenoid-binding protein YceI